MFPAKNTESNYRDSKIKGKSPYLYSFVMIMYYTALKIIGAIGLIYLIIVCLVNAVTIIGNYPYISVALICVIIASIYAIIRLYKW